MFARLAADLMKTVHHLKYALTSSAQTLVIRKEHVALMLNARWLERMSSAHVPKDLLEYPPLNKAVSESQLCAPMEDVHLNTSARRVCATLDVPSMVTVPEERSVIMDCASRCAGMTETVFKEKSVWTASASLVATRRRTVGLVRSVPLASVSVTRASSAPLQDVRTSMNVRMQSVIEVQNVEMFLDHTSAIAQ